MAPASSTGAAPVSLQPHIAAAAAALADELRNESLSVELFPARHPRYQGHMIRVATGVNPPWYRQLAASIPPRHRHPTRCTTGIRRPLVLRALERLAAGRPRGTAWESVILPVVRAHARVAVLAVLLLAPLAAMTVDGYALGLSYHTDRTAGYRELNPGAGLGLSFDLGDGWEATGLGMVYRDSIGNRGSAAGLGCRYTVGPRTGIHGTATIVAGYLDGSGYAGPVALPTLGAGYGPVTIEATYNPERETAAAWLRIAWRVGQ